MPTPYSSKGFRCFRPAFTLTETLITLAIIGIITALTVPTLITKYDKHQTATKLKQTYATVLNAYQMAQKDFGPPTTWDLTLTGKNYWETYLLPYLKIAKMETASDIGGIKYYSYAGVYINMLQIVAPNNNQYIVTLPTGVQIIFSDNVKGASTIFDLNGTKNDPNKFGKDTFFFDLNNGKFLPFCNHDNETRTGELPEREKLITRGAQNYACSKTGDGMFYGALIMKDGWQIKDDYPW